ncbi:hypothetical protein D915_005159 [Fasciola hepatica]|uniref:Uncharacterized protein n=1 Tax=Fasciola hepatica TaxID=6192 RepID=A0A4E0RCT0_FASHE|nr:hypothetical protein D915_005159 [Fasciola hepatica]
MSINRNSPLEPIAEDLRLFCEAISDEENEDLLKNLSVRSELDDSDSHTSTLSIDDMPLAHRRQASVPPLELTSRDSSLFTGNDPFMDHPNINLRSDSEDEVVTESSESDLDPSPSKRWEEFNAKLQRIEERQDMKNASKNRNKKSFLEEIDRKRTIERVITIRNEPNGHFQSGSADEQLPKIDFTKANKIIPVKKQKPTQNSYQSLYEIKVPHGDSFVSEPPGSRTTERTRYKSEILVTNVNRSHDMPHFRSREFTMNENNWSKGRYSERDEIGNDASNKERWNSFTGSDSHPRAAASRIQTRSQMNCVNPIHRDKKYYVHSVSSSGIYRLCAKQQADLERAHHRFREKYAESCPTPLFTRLNIQCPPLRLPDRTKSACSTPQSRCPKSPFPDPFAFRVPHRSECWQVRNRRNRYTMHDASSLPRVFNEARSLGPDLESDDYKSRRAKVNRQRSYSNRIRELAHKSKMLSSDFKLATTFEQEERPISGASFGYRFTASEKECDTHMNPDKQHPEDPIPNGSLESQLEHSKSDTLSSIKETDKNGSQKSRNLPHTKDRLDPGTKQNSTELERKKAAKKRENMLSYAVRVRTELMDTRKRKGPASDQPATLSKDRPIITAGNNDVDDSVMNTRMIELLKRHEQDRKVAESIHRALKFEI